MLNFPSKHRRSGPPGSPSAAPTPAAAAAAHAHTDNIGIGAVDGLSPQLLPPAAAALGSIPISAILQRFPGVWYIFFLLFVIFGPVVAPVSFSALYIAYHILFVINNVRMAFSTHTAYHAARLHSMTDWAEKYCQTTGAASTADSTRELPMDDVVHVIVVPNYKEGMDTLCETLEVLASHAYALTQYKVCLAMEESEAGSEAKARALIRQYGDLFLELTLTIHPVGLPGEIRGKSSNVAWAAREMARRSPSPAARSREILTVMDADSGFAQDYFSAVAYHYAVASLEQRRIMMFAPSTVFDRNSANVPIFVRTADMVWSAGVLANLYPSSPIKVPCSAYSLSMDLAVAVGFWDTDPTAIGEDMHMYLKCFFATEGRVIVTSIFSPASQCNVQGSTWLETARDRYVQSKRHMWGSLDVGYILRRSLFALLAPGYDAPAGVLQEVPLIRPEATRGSQEIQVSFTKLIHLAHRIFEANMILGQVFVIVFLTSLTLPVPNSPSPFAPALWSLITTEAVHPYVALAASLGGYIRMATTIPFLIMLYHYEKYQFWVGTERWIWSLREQVRPGSGQHVQPLGKRPQLASVRTVLGLADWLMLPICGLLYLAMPQIHVHVLQLWTDRLDYKVAGKPTVNGANVPLLPLNASETVSHALTDPAVSSGDTASLAINPAVITVRMAESTSLHSSSLRPSVSNSSLLTSGEDNDGKSVVSSRGDSGFFDFDDIAITSGAPMSPSLWRQYVPSRSSRLSESGDVVAVGAGASGIGSVSISANSATVSTR